MARTYSFWQALARLVDVASTAVFIKKTRKLAAKRASMGRMHRWAPTIVVANDIRAATDAIRSTSMHRGSILRSTHSASGAAAINRTATLTASAEALCHLSRRLEHNGLTNIQTCDDAVTIPSRGKNDVTITIGHVNGKFTFQLEGIYEDTRSEQDVIDWVTTAHHEPSRLRIDSIRGRPFRWTLEHRDVFGEWHDGLSTGHVRITTFWTIVRSHYRSFCSPY
jgi:hypothetical protein